MNDEQDVREKIIKDFRDTCKMILMGDADCILLLPVDNRWEKPLPGDHNGMFYISISGWTKENTYFTKEGVNITTAFRDEPNSAFFKWEEIVSLHDKSVKPLLIRTFDPNLEKKKPKQVKAKSIYEYIDAQKE